MSVFCFQCSLTSSSPRRKRIPAACRWFLRDGFGGFLPQRPYIRRGPRRGFTFGLPAHRSFGRRGVEPCRQEIKRATGPYIPGLKRRGFKVRQVKVYFRHLLPLLCLLISRSNSYTMGTC